MAASKKPDQASLGDSGVTGQYKNWFLDYASYVILERAVPALEDGLSGAARSTLGRTKEIRR